MVEPPDFTSYLLCHLRNSLHPVTPDNARILRMTAAAGTETRGYGLQGYLITAAAGTETRGQGLPGFLITAAAGTETRGQGLPGFLITAAAGTLVKDYKGI